MNISSKEKTVDNRKRLLKENVVTIMAFVDVMLKSKSFKSIHTDPGIVSVFKGDFDGLLTRYGASKDFLMFHSIANKHCDTFSFPGCIEGSYIYLLDERYLSEIKVI